jgi:ATP-dependent Clp protease ATP-binding subunit ClpA
MFSEMIREALAHEVIGQPYAVNSVVRGVTRLASGMTPLERSLCAYLFVGPPGTGRAHLVRSLARILYGDEAVLTLNCNASGHPDPWLEFLYQLAPLLEEELAQQATPEVSFAGMPPDGLSMHSGPPSAPSTPGSPSAPNIMGGMSPMGPMGSMGSMGQMGPMEAPAAERGQRPMRIILVQDLERARKELYPLLARALETGQVALPGGKRLRLTGCIFFFTTGLCTDQILDQSSRIGFAGATREDDEEERGSLYKICREEAENVFGLDLLTQFDNLIVFRKLDESHLADVLDRHFERMNRWLERRGFRGELAPDAREYLLGLGGDRSGTHDLIRAHRREVEFPVADLLLSGRLEPGGSVLLEHRKGDEHLHLTVEPPEEGSCDPGAGSREISVTV